MFLDQLTKTLEADEAGEGAASERISGASGGVAPVLSEIDVLLNEERSVEANERLGLLVHELRNALQTSNLSVRALELGNLPISGATGVVLKRSLAAMCTLVDQALGEVRSGATANQVGTFAVADLIADAKASGELRERPRRAAGSLWPPRNRNWRCTPTARLCFLLSRTCCRTPSSSRRRAPRSS